jgi:hypothetical protein
VRWRLIGRPQLRLCEFLNSDRPRTLLAPRRHGATATAPLGATARLLRTATATIQTKLEADVSERYRRRRRRTSKPASNGAASGPAASKRLQSRRQVLRPPPNDFKVVGKCSDRLQAHIFVVTIRSQQQFAAEIAAKRHFWPIGALFRPLGGTRSTSGPSQRRFEAVRAPKPRRTRRARGAPSRRRSSASLLQRATRRVSRHSCTGSK